MVLQRTRPARHADTRSRVRSGLASAAVLALALTACGGGEDGGEDAAAPSSPASASGSPSESPSTSPSAEATESGDEAARQEYVDAVNAGAQSGDVSVRTEVTTTVDSPQGEIETKVEGITQLQDGTLTARFDTTLPASATGGEEQTVRTLIVDGSFYVQVPGTPGGKFQQIDLADAGGQLGEQLQQQLDQIDPRKQAAAAIDSIVSVEKLGEGTVNGVDVTEYRITQDFAGFAENQDNALYDQLLQAGQLPDTLVSTVSLDDDGRTRRSVVDLEVQGTEARTVSDFLEYDVDVDITAPPNRRVVQSPGAGGNN